uniref:Mitochondrial resolvase Ydc2 catalytic domain-containing protein n=1 Tax=viral metagenome TaxID=1070528 RepID=A0A6C0JHM7_9ZZZZ
MCTRIISIDVGIKNLAFCLFEKHANSTYFSIAKWDIINLSQEDEIQKCQCTEKNGVICNKPAKYTLNDNFFCLKHSKKQEYQIPTSELKTTFINKQKFQKLIDIADKYNIQYEKPIKKNDLLFKINEHISNKCFKEIKVTNASQIDLITIGKNIKNKFNKIFPVEDKIDYVLIENQISPIANRMKTIQGMIAQYFIMNNNTEHIEFVSSINKLKQSSGKTIEEQPSQQPQDKASNDYKSRKKQGILKCLEILTTEHSFTNQLSYFNIHKKKDDLSDSFLQGLWFIKNKHL